MSVRAVGTGIRRQSKGPVGGAEELTDSNCIQMVRHHVAYFDSNLFKAQSAFLALTLLW